MSAMKEVRENQYFGAHLLLVSRVRIRRRHVDRKWRFGFNAGRSCFEEETQIWSRAYGRGSIEVEATVLVVVVEL
jgi:hypothetical protein